MIGSYFNEGARDALLRVEEMAYVLVDMKVRAGAKALLIRGLLERVRKSIRGGKMGILGGTNNLRHANMAIPRNERGPLLAS